MRVTAANRPATIAPPIAGPETLRGRSRPAPASGPPAASRWIARAAAAGARTTAGRVTRIASPAVTVTIWKRVAPRDSRIRFSRRRRSPRRAATRMTANAARTMNWRVSRVTPPWARTSDCWTPARIGARPTVTLIAWRGGKAAARAGARPGIAWARPGSVGGRDLAGIQARPPGQVEPRDQAPRQEVGRRDHQRPLEGDRALVEDAVEVEGIAQPVGILGVGRPGPGDHDRQQRRVGGRRDRGVDQPELVADRQAHGCRVPRSRGSPRSGRGRRRASRRWRGGHAPRGWRSRPGPSGGARPARRRRPAAPATLSGPPG